MRRYRAAGLGQHLDEFTLRGSLTLNDNVCATRESWADQGAQESSSQSAHSETVLTLDGNKTGKIGAVMFKRISFSIFLLAVLAELARAQTCPSGMVPFPWGVTRDGDTAQPRQIFCQDKNGNINFTALRGQVLSSVRYAENFPGADLGAKINAADTDLGSGPGEIWVTKIGTISTAVTLSAGHDLYFTKGVYNATAEITLNGSNHVHGSGVAGTIIRATAAMGNLVSRPAIADRVTLSDIAFDGNSLATNVVNFTRTPEGPSLDRISRVRINAPAAGGKALIMDGCEDSVLSESFIENVSGGNYPDLTFIATGVHWDVQTGDSEIHSTWVYGPIEIAAQNFSIHGGLFAGVRAIGGVGALTVVGAQIVPLPDTKIMFEVGNGASLSSLNITGAFLAGVRDSGSFFDSTGTTKGTWGYEIVCQGCLFNSYGASGSTPLFGSNFTAMFTSSPPMLMFTGGAIGGNVTETYPASSNGRVLKLGFPGGTNLNLSNNSLAIGLAPARGGALRLDNEGAIYGRNAANSADILLAKINSGNQIEIGQSGNSVRLSSGVLGDGAGFKHARTPITDCAAGGCEVVLSWATAWGDINYTPVCSILDATAQSETAGLRLAKILTKTVNALTVDIDNLSARSVSGTLNCIGVHD